MSSTDMHDLQTAIGQLRRCVGSLRSRYGDAASVRRLTNDLDRLDIDARDFQETPPRPLWAASEDRIPIPDSPYDEPLFRGVDADDEGLGGLHGER